MLTPIKVDSSAPPGVIQVGSAALLSDVDAGVEEASVLLEEALVLRGVKLKGGAEEPFDVSFIVELPINKEAPGLHALGEGLHEGGDIR